MFRRCLFCHAPFPGNRTLEHFDRGARVAYDPDRGRLWAICARCRRWSLAPILERWEALEELERGVRDRGRLLASTENIGLHDLDGLEVVRVGPARSVEEAWWRYGEGLVRRRRKYLIHGAIAVTAVGALAAGGLAAGVGAATVLNLANVSVQLLHLRHARKGFGTRIWRGEAPCPGCGAVLREVRFEQQDRLIVVPGQDAGEDPIRVRFRCFRCGRRTPEAGYRFGPLAGEQVLRRALAYRNRKGATEGEVKRAARLIREEGAGDPRAALRRLTDERPQLGEVGRTELLAMEIAAGEDRERRLLELEATALEARWREEERLAAIVDGELTPVAGLDRLRDGAGGEEAPSVGSC